MKVGITGHQDRAGIDWSWVAKAVRDELSSVPTGLIGLSSLARGADQLFADVLLEAGGELHFVVPIANYEKTLEGKHLAHFLELKRAATETIELPPAKSEQDAYLAAGEYIASHSDLLIAVWDGKPAVGKGGTADVVAFAKRQGRAVLHIEPLNKQVGRV